MPVLRQDRLRLLNRRILTAERIPIPYGDRLHTLDLQSRYAHTEHSACGLGAHRTRSPLQKRGIRQHPEKNPGEGNQ